MRSKEMAAMLVAALLAMSACNKTPDAVQGGNLNSVKKINVTCAPATDGGVGTSYNTNFTRGNLTARQWTGADATYSFVLGNDQTSTTAKRCWMFGDTFVGYVHPADASHAYRWRQDNNPGDEGFTPNTLMVQSGSTFTTVVGNGALSAAPSPWPGLYQPLIKTGHDFDAHRALWWPGDATVINNVAYMFYTRFNSSGCAESCDLFEYPLATLTGVSGTLAQLAPPATSTNYYSLPGNVDSTKETYFGAAILEDTFDYYVYISDKAANGLHYAKLLKMQTHIKTGSKYYFNGYGAAPSYSASFALAFSGAQSATGRMKELNGTTLTDLNVSPQFSVLKIGTKYRLITQGEWLSKDIWSYESDQPWGPWSCKTRIFTTPETLYTYNAFVHPEVRNGAQYLLSYNVQPTDLNNADQYRPKFRWINIP